MIQAPRRGTSGTCGPTSRGRDSETNEVLAAIFEHPQPGRATTTCAHGDPRELAVLAAAATAARAGPADARELSHEPDRGAGQGGEGRQLMKPLRKLEHDLRLAPKPATVEVREGNDPAVTPTESGPSLGILGDRGPC